MNTNTLSNDFNAVEYIANAAQTDRIDGISFYVQDAAKHLLENPSIGQFSPIVSLQCRWEARMMTPESQSPCLVALTDKDTVIAIIYTEDHEVRVASSREMPQAILQAFGDMLQCLSCGQSAWVRRESEFFHEAFETLTEQLPEVTYDASWANGTGYLDNACYQALDGAKRFVDPHGRRGVLLPVNGDECIVVFQRYGTQTSTLVYNAPHGYLNCCSGVARDQAHIDHLITSVLDALQAVEA